MSDNIQNRCRICLDVGANHVSVLGDPTIYLHIKSCLSINILSNDDLPKKICSSCVSQLKEFYNFQLNAKCSQDWLESILNVKKKSWEPKLHVQPLPDSEYNSDSLLEFLNNTVNIEDYLNNLGREDIPSIVNMLDRTAEVSAGKTMIHKYNQPSPKKKEMKEACLNMDVDVLDSDIEIVQEILMKETEPKKGKLKTIDGNNTCFGCDETFETIQKLCQHLPLCEMASRTCIHCNLLFDSTSKLKQHSLTHTTQLSCHCTKEFNNQEQLIQHYNNCNMDHTVPVRYIHRCKECKEMFQDPLQLYRHAKEHVVAAQTRICDVCGHEFAGDEELSKHKKEKHDILEGILYKCKLCSLTGSNRKEVYIHIQRHLELKENHKHLCEHCGKSFSTLTTLLRHSQQHTTVQCHLCNISFNSENDLHKHMFQHTEISMCDKCGLNVLSNKFSTHHCS